LGSRSNQRRRSRSGSRGGRSASRGSRSAGVEEDAQHLGVPAPGGSPARRWTSKAGNGEDRQRCTLPRLATNRLRSLTRGVEQQRAGRRGERGCAIAIYRREGFRRTSPSRVGGSFTFPREPAAATLPTRGRRRNRPTCAACSRAPGKRTLAAFPGSQAEAAFLASRSRAPSQARCANKATCSPGAQPGCWAEVANTPLVTLYLNRPAAHPHRTHPPHTLSPALVTPYLNRPAAHPHRTHPPHTLSLPLLNSSALRTNGSASTTPENGNWEAPTLPDSILSRPHQSAAAHLCSVR
jgi:hypothetical protein